MLVSARAHVCVCVWGGGRHFGWGSTLAGSTPASAAISPAALYLWRQSEMQAAAESLPTASDIGSSSPCLGAS